MPEPPAPMIPGRRRSLEAWQATLPETGAFTHLTAARAYGWWMPPLPDVLPVFASMREGDVRPRRRGLLVTRHPEPPAHRMVDGLRLTTPEETLLACARDLALLDLIVLCDAALQLGSTTTDQLAEVARARRRGAPLLRRAVALADRRSQSPWESALRILHVTCEVAVEPQHRATTQDGAFLAQGDLWIVGTQHLHEYDGAVHRGARQHHKDLGRDRRLANAGWTRRGYTNHEVLFQGISILRDADAALRRSHEPERIRPWHVLLAESLLTPSGQERLRLRLHLPASPRVKAA